MIIDGPDSWCQTLQAEKLAEKFVGIDFSDAETVFDRCLAAVKKIKKAGVAYTDRNMKDVCLCMCKAPCFSAWLGHRWQNPSGTSCCRLLLFRSLGTCTSRLVSAPACHQLLQSYEESRRHGSMCISYCTSPLGTAYVQCFACHGTCTMQRSSVLVETLEASTP